MTEYLIGQERASRRAEVMIANHYAERHGYEKVRGGQHGRGWDEEPSPNQWRIIKRMQNFSKTRQGEELLRKLEPIDPTEWKVAFEAKNPCPS